MAYETLLVEMKEAVATITLIALSGHTEDFMAVTAFARKKIATFHGR